MSLPSSEPLPSDINELPPARQRHIRRQPQSASFAEREILLDSLLKLTAPTVNFFFLSLIGALITGLALYFDEPTILILAIVIFPFHRPVFGLSLFPNTQKGRHGLTSLISLLILSGLTFASGALAGWLRDSASFDNVNFYRFSAPYWLDLTILIGSTLLSTLVILRQGRLPRLAGIFLSYMLLIPLAVAGFGLTIGQSQLWPSALLLALTHLCISIVLAIFSFLVLGFPPKNHLGWLTAGAVFILSLVLFTGSVYPTILQYTQIRETTPTSVQLNSPTLTPSPQEVLSATPTIPTETETPTLIASQTPTPSQTPTLTSTLEPTSYWAVIEAALGAIIRESPSIDAPPISYINDGDEIEILGELTPPGGARWFEVRLDTGEVGWLLGALVNTQTPAPTGE